ncbi:hypothetical protein QFC19_006647 [Naganishia cerealis]|uniref:Uncharacterized protein n=1 Tax=Naganishia cerealis TaxID=610337 RepID=A0ACC2VEN8_9TREE|nr:hypothetical protein QFC19_006647 [Naganishia cerealis]
MTNLRAASSTPTLSHATPRRIPGSASSSETSYHLTRDRPRRASGTPTSRPSAVARDSSETPGIKVTRARVGPLPKNGPGNPLFPPLPPKSSNPRRGSQMSQLERMESRVKEEEEKEVEEGKEQIGDENAKETNQDQGDAATAAAAAESDVQQDRGDGDQETMTSGLSDDGADAVSAHDSDEEGEIKPVSVNSENDADLEETTATTGDAKEETDTIMESKPPNGDTDAAAAARSSTAKRSLRTRGTGDHTPSTDAKRALRESGDSGEQKEDADVDMDGDEDAVVDAGAARKGREVKKDVDEEEEEEAEEEEEEVGADEELVEHEQQGQVDANGDVTRCICGREGMAALLTPPLIHASLTDPSLSIDFALGANIEYFCELCKPGLHAPLKRYLRYRQKHGQGFAIPTPEDLEHHHYNSDRIKPSQSKRWTDPSVIKDESMSPPPQTSTHPTPTSHKAGGGSGTGKSHKAGAGKARSPSTTTTTTTTTISTLDTRRAAAGAGHRAHSGMSDKSHHSEFKVPAVVASAASTSVGASGGVARPSVAGGAGATISGRRVSTASSSDTIASPVIGTGTAGATGGGGPSSKGKDGAPWGPGKKRSTMNSWDAAYEEAIAASLREAATGGGVAGETGVVGTRSRRGVGVAQESQDDDEGDKRTKKPAANGGAGSRGVKRTRQEEEEGEEGPDDVYVVGGVRKGKKKKDEVDASNKPKHPNQYTYRPKGATSGSAAPPTPTTTSTAPMEKPTRTVPHSPTKRQTPSAGAGSNTASRRFAAGGTRGGTPSSVSGSIVTPRPTNLIGKHKTDAVLAYETALSNGETPTHLEPPTRVRYPSKRMTIGEMRKRVRNLLEYVGRVQGEEDKRAQRAKLLELTVSSSSATVEAEKSSQPEGESSGAQEVAPDVQTRQDTATTAEPQPMEVDPASSQSAQIVDSDVPHSDKENPTTPSVVDDATKAADADVAMEEPPAPTSAKQGEPATEEQKTETETTAKGTGPTSNGEATASETSAPTLVPTLDLPAESTISPSAPPPSHPPTAPTASVPATGGTMSASASVEPPSSKSSQLLAELTSELIKFQMMFEVGGSVFAAPSNGGIVPGTAMGGVDDE